MKEVVTAFADKGDAAGVKAVQSTGLHVGGQRYVVLKADDRSLYGKKVHPPCPAFPSPSPPRWRGGDLVHTWFWRRWADVFCLCVG